MATRPLLRRSGKVQFRRRPFGEREVVGVDAPQGVGGRLEELRDEFRLLRRRARREPAERRAQRKIQAQREHQEEDVVQHDQLAADRQPREEFPRFDGLHKKFTCSRREKHRLHFGGAVLPIRRVFPKLRSLATISYRQSQDRPQIVDRHRSARSPQGMPGEEN
jgi:hypothetical protein